MSKNEELKPVCLVEDEATGARFLLYTMPNEVVAELRFEDDQPWFTQAQLAEIFGVDVRTANEHVQKFLADGELNDSVIRKFRITATDGKSYNVQHYALDVAFYVGYRVNSAQGILFRRWATQVLLQYATKGFVIDVRRLKEPESVDRVRELREIIRDIRASEANMYAELRRICSLCQDYDPKSDAAREFHQRMQAKLFYAVTSKTPSMIIMERADASKPNMGLATWPKADIRQSDALIAKGYLVEIELGELNRLTVILLDIFEDQLAIGKLTLMREATELLDAQLMGLRRAVLTRGGSVAHKDAEAHAKREYKKFDAQRRLQRKASADAELAELRKTGASLPTPGRKNLRRKP